MFYQGTEKGWHLILLDIQRCPLLIPPGWGEADAARYEAFCVGRWLCRACVYGGRRRRVRLQVRDRTRAYVIILPMEIGLNAQLLSHQDGYRSAGIHGYIANLLARLPAQAPEGWRLNALVSGASRADFAGVRMKRAPFDTSSPMRRIFWEQAIQPLELRAYDLYHAMAFVAPLILISPMVVTVYDLSFMRFPDRLSAARRLYLRSMTALTCARARRVLAISQSTADDLTALLGVPSGKIDVTPLGYDKSAISTVKAERARDFSAPAQFAGALLALCGHAGAAQESANAAAGLCAAARGGASAIDPGWRYWLARASGAGRHRETRAG